MMVLANIPVAIDMEGGGAFGTIPNYPKAPSTKPNLHPIVVYLGTCGRRQYTSATTRLASDSDSS